MPSKPSNHGKPNPHGKKVPAHPTPHPVFGNPALTRRAFEKFEPDSRYLTRPKTVDRLSLLLDPREYLVPTSSSKPRDLHEAVQRLVETGMATLVQDRSIKQLKGLKVKLTHRGRARQMVNAALLNRRDFSSLPYENQNLLATYYLVDAILARDFHPVRKAYSHAGTINRTELIQKFQTEANVEGVKATLRRFGPEKEWPEYFFRYAVFLRQRARIAKVVLEVMDSPTWGEIQRLREQGRLTKLLP